jgi:hypothetical protein
MDIEAIKERILTAKEAVANLPEPLKTEAFGVVLSKLLDDLQEIGKAAVGEALIVGKSSEEPPSISGTTSCREAIAKLFASEWGRKPKGLREIIDAMKLNAVYYSDQNVAVELQRMTKLGLLRRLKDGKAFKYVSAKPVST